MTPIDAAQAEAILREYAPGVSVDRAASLLDRYTVERIVEGQAVALIDPYAAAVAYIMSPDTVTERKQGDVSEKYVDPLKIVGYLQGESERLRLSWPLPDELVAVTTFDTDLILKRWGS